MSIDAKVVAVVQDYAKQAGGSDLLVLTRKELDLLMQQARAEGREQGAMGRDAGFSGSFSDEVREAHELTRSIRERLGLSLTF